MAFDKPKPASVVAEKSAKQKAEEAEKKAKAFKEGTHDDSTIGTDDSTTEQDDENISGESPKTKK